MKKILVLLLLMMSTIVFSETLEKVTYRNGVYTATFKENKKVNSNMTYNEEQSVLTLDFTNLKIKNNIPKVMKVNDQYVESINLTEVAGITSLTFYLKSGVEYKVLTGTKQTQVMFSKKKSDTGTNSIPASVKKKMTIVVDAGHGGHDSGAVGNGYREKDIALDVSRRLAANLKKDYNVIMTRSTDVFIPLQERAAIGNRAKADLFVSIHLNSSTNSSANGAEVFYYSKKETTYAAEVAKFENSVDKGAASISFSDFIINDIFYRINQQKSAALATDVLNNLVNNFSVRRRGVFGANFAVLRGSDSPSILVELGFMSNYGDVSQFVTSSGQERAAIGIANAIRKHFD